MEIVLLFFLIAFVYSSVGFGGGSSYLAILTLFGIDYLTLRTVALLCNITVVSGSAFVYWRKGMIRFKKVLPLIAVSIPAAFIGGSIGISERVFFLILAFTLLIASVAMFFQPVVSDSVHYSKYGQIRNAGIGGAIGFLAGLVGIGGGIFLSPLLHLSKWDRAIVIASTSSVYILANSLSGLLGQFSHHSLQSLNIPFVLSLMAAVAIGGQLGVRVGIVKFDPKKLKRITAVLVFLVAIRILYKYAING